MIGGLYIFKLCYLASYWMGVVFPLAFFAVLWMSGRKYGRKATLICLIALPIFSFALCNICVRTGFHYRMELRERFGKDEHGNMNIYRMPPAVFAEYDADDRHPRQKDCTAMLFLGWLVLPAYCLLLSPFYLIIRRILKL